MTPPDRAPESLSAAIPRAFEPGRAALAEAMQDTFPSMDGGLFVSRLEQILAQLDRRGFAVQPIRALDAARDSRPDHPSRCEHGAIREPCVPCREAEARDSRPVDLLARWPDADLFAALDAEGWFRGMETKEATAATAKVYARLARDSRPVGEGLREAIESFFDDVAVLDKAYVTDDDRLLRAAVASVLNRAPRLRAALAPDQPASTEAGEDG